MDRHIVPRLLVLIAAGLVFAMPAAAADNDLREKVRQLEEKLETITDQQSANLEQSIEDYLEESSAWRGTQGDDSLSGVSITASLTAQWAAKIEPGDRSSVVSGEVDLGFHFNVTENLDLFVMVTANGYRPGRTAEVGGFVFCEAHVRRAAWSWAGDLVYLCLDERAALFGHNTRALLVRLEFAETAVSRVESRRSRSIDPLTHRDSAAAVGVGHRVTQETIPPERGFALRPRNSRTGRISGSAPQRDAAQAASRVVIVV